MYQTGYYATGYYQTGYYLYAPAVGDIVNLTATTVVPQNYLICDRTGFKVDRVVQEWGGLITRMKSYEDQHPQDNLKGFADTIRGSQNPEGPDEFISDLFPNGVNPEDF